MDYILVWRGALLITTTRFVQNPTTVIGKVSHAFSLYNSCIKHIILNGETFGLIKMI